jgi:hypothetical protein
MTTFDDLNARLAAVEGAVAGLRSDLDAMKPAPTPTPTPTPPPSTGPAPSTVVHGPATVDQEAASYLGAWQQGVYSAAYQGSDRYSSAQGARVRIDFVGSAVQVWGTKDTHHGTALAMVDAVGFPQLLDFRASSRQEHALIGTIARDPGQHFLEIAVQADGVVAIDEFIIDGGSPTPPRPRPRPPLRPRRRRRRRPGRSGSSRSPGRTSSTSQATGSSSPARTSTSTPTSRPAT